MSHRWRNVERFLGEVGGGGQTMRCARVKGVTSATDGWDSRRTTRLLLVLLWVVLLNAVCNDPSTKGIPTTELDNSPSPSQIIPTSTPTLTPVEPPATPSATSVPPTATPVPSTATPIPPTATPVPPTSTPRPGGPQFNCWPGYGTNLMLTRWLWSIDNHANLKNKTKGLI